MNCKYLIEQHKILVVRKEEEFLSLNFFSVALFLESYFNVFRLGNRGDYLLKTRLSPAVEKKFPFKITVFDI